MLHTELTGGGPDGMQKQQRHMRTLFAAASKQPGGAVITTTTCGLEIPSSCTATLSLSHSLYICPCTEAPLQHAAWLKQTQGRTRRVGDMVGGHTARALASLYTVAITSCLRARLAARLAAFSTMLRPVCACAREPQLQAWLPYRVAVQAPSCRIAKRARHVSGECDAPSCRAGKRAGHGAPPPP